MMIIRENYKYLCSSIIVIAAAEVGQEIFYLVFFPIEVIKIVVIVISRDLKPCSMYTQS